ncbi:uncharacterized protein LOC106652377 [Trichogramma pretiosum]|uniref:uncharacterized protein LOC106652377 n=1 Tax=Trichogramma pretiosum TaxID=7493 RepID=UPI000C719417|nr:uncharacterized protein LOC106652377 [Trichogramma pretiosum]
MHGNFRKNLIVNFNINSHVNLNIFYMGILEESTFCYVNLHELFRCPNLCICKWKGGKEWVECTSRGLTYLPQGAPEETQVYNLSGNHISTLEDNSFLKLGLTNLQRLYISHSGIKFIHNDAFTNLQGLVELDVSYNGLSQVSSEVYKNIVNLARLNLAGNPIHFLENHSFSTLKQLTLLDLSYCKLINISTSAFEGLNKLQWLRLNNNLLTHISSEAIPKTSLRGLTLHENPWICDCRLLSLRKFLISIKKVVAMELRPICKQPKQLQNKVISDLAEKDMSCIPSINISKTIKAYETDNVTLECEVYSTPSAYKMWFDKNHKYNISNVDESKRLENFQIITKTKVVLIIKIMSVHLNDGGEYVCYVENTAGVTKKILTLEVIQDKQAHNKPENRILNTDFVNITAIGALFGSLSALGCIFFCVYIFSHYETLNCKNFVTFSKFYEDLIINQEQSKMSSQTHSNGNTHKNYDVISISKNSNDGDHSDMINSNLIAREMVLNVVSKNEACLENDTELRTYYTQPNFTDKFCSEKRISVNNYPDIGNSSERFSFFFDSDGYPLNFGLPKISSKIFDSPVLINAQLVKTRYQNILPFLNDFKQFDSEKDHPEPLFKIKNDKLDNLYKNNPPPVCSCEFMHCSMLSCQKSLPSLCIYDEKKYDQPESYCDVTTFTHVESDVYDEARSLKNTDAGYIGAIINV